MAELLISKQAEIKIANDRDLELAEVNKLQPSLINRLELDGNKIESLAIGIQKEKKQ